MIEPKFYLKNPRSDNDTRIIMKIYYGSKSPFKYYLPISVHPSNWDKKNGQYRKEKLNKDSAYVNNFLAKVTSKIRSYYIQCFDEEEPITKDNLKILMNKICSGLKTTKQRNKKTTFLSYIDIFIETQKTTVSEGRIKRYKVFKNHFLNFQKYMGYEYDFNDITFSFKDNLQKYFFEELEITPNTAGVQIAILKKIMKESFKNKLHSNNDYIDFSKPSNKVTSVYLNDIEILRIWNTKFDEPYLQKTKDIFVFACLVGLRYSDFSEVKAHHVTMMDGTCYLSKITKKTKESVLIPVKPIAFQILQKYNFELPLISNQKLNTYLKELCQLSGMTAPVSKMIFKGSKQVEKTFKKYELISSHTARRSFCTNAYLAGVPVLSIMMLSGHTTEKAFMKYICITKEQNAKRLALHAWFIN